jgi:hypothetical protein
MNRLVATDGSFFLSVGDHHSKSQHKASDTAKIAQE